MGVVLKRLLGGLDSGSRAEGAYRDGFNAYHCTVLFPDIVFPQWNKFRGRKPCVLGGGGVTPSYQELETSVILVTMITYTFNPWGG